MFWKKNICNPTPNYFAVCGRTWRGTTRGGEGGGCHNQPADAPLVQQVSSVVALNSYISSIPFFCKDLVGRCPWTSSRWWSRTEEATRWSATAPASRTRLSQTWSSSEKTSSKQDQGKEHFWQHFNFLRNTYKKSLLLSFRLEFINAKGELQVNNHIYNKSWKIILDQSHFSADCWFTGDFKSHRWMFWTCGNRHRHHVEVGHLKLFSAQDLPKGWTRWRGPSFTQRRLWWETQSLGLGQRGSEVFTES